MNLIYKTIYFMRGHYTLSQTWNTFKYVLSKKTTYLKYSPISLNIYVTDRCNQHCNMCHQHSLNRPLNNPYRHDPCDDMSFSKFKQIADMFRQAIFLNLAGTGEPFSNEDIFDMIKYGANVRRMAVSCITNGTLLGDKIDQIINSPLHLISISVNGYNAEEFGRMTKNPKQNYNDILTNISQLVEKKRSKGSRSPQIRILHIVYKGNYKYIPNVVKLADELGVDSLVFFNLLPVDIPGFTEDQCLYEDDQDVIDVISSVERPKSKLVVYTPNLLQRVITKRVCSDYFEKIRVDSRGSVTSCGAIIQASERYGNVFRDKDVWNNDHFRNMRRMFLGNSVPLLDCCRICEGNSNYKRVIIKGEKAI